MPYLARGRTVAIEHKFGMQGVFIGHQSFYNENQIRDNLILVLVFFMRDTCS